MAETQLAETVPEEIPTRQERAFAFVSVVLTQEAYLKSIVQRFGSRLESRKFGGCPYDYMADVVEAKVGADNYFFKDETTYGVCEIYVMVRRAEAGKDPVGLASLTLFLPIGAPKKGKYETTVSVPRVKISEQNCSDEALKTILKNIAPAGLEAVLVT